MGVQSGVCLVWLCCISCVLGAPEGFWARITPFKKVSFTLSQDYDGDIQAFYVNGIWGYTGILIPFYDDVCLTLHARDDDSTPRQDEDKVAGNGTYLVAEGRYDSSSWIFFLTRRSGVSSPACRSQSTFTFEVHSLNTEPLIPGQKTLPMWLRRGQCKLYHTDISSPMIHLDVKEASPGLVIYANTSNPSSISYRDNGRHAYTGPSGKVISNPSYVSAKGMVSAGWYILACAENGDVVGAYIEFTPISVAGELSTHFLDMVGSKADVSSLKPGEGILLTRPRGYEWSFKDDWGVAVAVYSCVASQEGDKCNDTLLQHVSL